MGGNGAHGVVRVRCGEHWRSGREVREAVVVRAMNRACLFGTLAGHFLDGGRLRAGV
jgi:hypothetical protein